MLFFLSVAFVNQNRLISACCVFPCFSAVLAVIWPVFLHKKKTGSFLPVKPSKVSA